MGPAKGATRKMTRRRPGALKKIGKTVGKLAKGAYGLMRPTLNNTAKILIPRITKAVIDKSVAAIAGGAFMPSARKGNMLLSNAPAAVGSTVRTRAPNVKTSRGSCRIVHSEYIGDIAARDPGTFDLQYIFGLNPGNGALFPWASKIAQQFDSYKFNNLTFRYMPLCGTQTQGVVVMAIDYDASDDPPASLQQMLTYKGAVQTNAWKPALNLSANSDLSKAKSHYVLSGVAPPNTDIKTYDIGNFYLAVNSIASAGAIGQLFVDYDVTFDTPQTELDPPSVGSRGVITLATDPQTVSALMVADMTGPLAAFWTVDPGNSGVQDLYLPVPGYYTLSFAQEASSTITYATSIVAQQGPALLNFFSNDSSANSFQQTIQFQVINPDQVALTFSNILSSVTVGETLSFYWAIQPLASELATSATFEPLPSLNNPRRRFGRTPVPV
jgi:hypothetical protein